MFRVRGETTIVDGYVPHIHNNICNFLFVQWRKPMKTNYKSANQFHSNKNLHVTDKIPRLTLVSRCFPRIYILNA